jgi:hypothetical protein
MTDALKFKAGMGTPGSLSQAMTARAMLDQAGVRHPRSGLYGDALTFGAGGDLESVRDVARSAATEKVFRTLGQQLQAAVRALPDRRRITLGELIQLDESDPRRNEEVGWVAERG